tara:strand:+ start:968 stop:1690 length:723 start_codon:yes stop_codon:yes gene_type:complete
MATTTATITLASSDIMDNSISVSNTATLTKAGNSTGLPDTTGLRRKRIASDVKVNLLKRESEGLTANGANKLYIKNTGTSATRFATISIGDIGGTATILGRLYGGDWMFIPWAAAQGVKESFNYTVTGAWEVGDIVTFDGVSVTGGSTTESAVASAINAAYFPNWTSTVSGAVVTFTAREAYDQITPLAASFVITDASSGSEATQTVATHTTDGTDSNDDIIVAMNDTTETVIEYMAVYE